jgi:hypothetical protein
MGNNLMSAMNRDGDLQGEILGWGWIEELDALEFLGERFFHLYPMQPLM